MKKLFILMCLIVIAISADAQSYRNRNGGFLINKSSAGHYNPNIGSSRAPSSNSSGFLIDNSSAGHYDGPVNTTVVNTESPSTTSTTSRSRTCSVCHGKGWYVHSQYMGSATAGKKMWCSTCGEEVNYGHSHRRCDTCHGSGTITD